MTAIALDAEQIRMAPPEVRQWILREVIASLELQNRLPVDEAPREHLAACNPKEVTAIFNQIQGVLPAVNVFFEFGRQGAVIPGANIEAFALLDIAHHTRLQSVAQVIGCIDIINQALGRIRGDTSITFCGFDQDGHCYVALETQQSILQLWKTVIADRQLAAGGEAPSPLPASIVSDDAHAGGDKPVNEQPVDKWFERDEELSDP